MCLAHQTEPCAKGRDSTFKSIEDDSSENMKTYTNVHLMSSGEFDL